MKKVFMPSMNGLYQMQDRNLDVYSYLVAKSVESLIAYGTNYPRKGILKKDNTYQYLLNDPEIVLPVCSICHELIPEFDLALSDVNLCLKLLDSTPSSSLDNLTYFSNSYGLLNNPIIIEKVIDKLSQILKVNPRYRFQYIDNSLIDKILACEIFTSPVHFKLSTSLPSLIKIEPYYGILLNSNSQDLHQGMHDYLERYFISSNYQVAHLDILTNPSLKVKRLLKTINKNQS